MNSLCKNKLVILPGLLTIIIVLSFSLLVVKDFQHPLSGGGDLEYWEYAGYYFAKNLTFLPFPHLDLVNNQAFYPYGVNGVFQPWSFERDLSYAVFYSFFGFVPWLQLYYLLSIIITLVGSFLLLFKDYGITRASGFSLIVTFFNFYSVHKYPSHLAYAIVHWTVLSFVADFIIVKRVTLRQNISLRFLIFRFFLLVLSLGQELGYVAGYALMSSTVSLIFIILLTSYRCIKEKWKLRARIQKVLSLYKTELITYPSSAIILIVLILIFSYLYLPLLCQISKEAKSFDFVGVPSGSWWVHPLRLFLPYFPNFNPQQSSLLFQKVFEDKIEESQDGSPGWFLLITGLTGLWQSRRKLIIFIPLLIIFVLCLLYVPENVQFSVGTTMVKLIFKLILLSVIFLSLYFVRKRKVLFIFLLLILLWLFFHRVGIVFPTLKIFPWFTFNRVQGRTTLIYSVILSLFALNLNFGQLSLLKKRIFSALLISLACLELYTAYSFKLNYYPYILKPDFFAYMNYVKQQPGEAVLDWPFCVVGANGVGADHGLCPLYRKNGSIFALRRFHEKKVLGQYFGRLHPSQVEAYIQAGWSNLLVSNDPSNIFKATRLARCFRPQEWEFFTKFYELNDFAGINLYVDLLPQECVEEFHYRFGSSSVTTVIPLAGKVEFIKKKAEQRRKVNPKLGIELKLNGGIKINGISLEKG